MNEIHVTYSKLETEDNQIHYFHSDDPEWSNVITEMWNQMCVEKDKPVQRNRGNQLPICDLYENDFELEKYLSPANLLGVDPIGKVVFGDMELKEKKEKDILIWSEMNSSDFIVILNEKLEFLSCKVNIIK